MTAIDNLATKSLGSLVLLAALVSPAVAGDWLCESRIIDGKHSRHCVYQGKPPSAGAQSTRQSTQQPVEAAKEKAASNAIAPAITPATPVNISTDASTSPRTAKTPGTTMAACQQPPLLDGLVPPGNDNSDHNRLGDLPVETIADEASLQNGVATFIGGVQFKSGNIELRAEHAEYYRDSQQVELNGGVLVASPTLQLAGENASFNLRDNSSAIHDARYVVRAQQIRGEAKSIRNDADGKSRILQGSYTRCLPEQNVWRVKASKIRLDPERGQGSARHARLELFDVPLFYVPYARFPIGNQRQSGFLFPRISDTNSGIDIALPYYINVASNFDAIVTPRYKNDHGYLTEGQFRWLNRFDQWQLNGAYIDSDESANDKSRWQLRVREQGKLGEGLSTRIDYNEVSDTEFLRDLNAASLSVSRSSLLEQSLDIAYQSLRWQGGVNIRRYQNVDPSKNVSDIYEQLPSSWLRYQSLSQPGRLSTMLELRHSEFDNDTLSEAARSYGHARIGLPLQFGTLELQPSVGYQRQYYDFSDAGFNTLDTGSGYGRLRLATTLEQSPQQFNHVPNANSIASTLEPSLTYLYREATDGRDDRQHLALFDSNTRSLSRYSLDALSQFTGHDIIEETDQLTAAMTYHQSNHNNQSHFSGTLGQVFYFRNPDDSIATAPLEDPSQRQSELLAELSYRRPDTRTLANLLWDSENNRINQGYAGLQLRHGPATRQRLFNLGYSYRRANPGFSLLNRDVEQAEVSAVAYLSSRWGLLGKYQYDLENQQRVESLAGIEYDGCCVKLRLVYRDGLIYDPLEVEKTDYDRKLFLQIELKGLMGVGSSLESALDESIPGYRSRF